MQNDGENTVCMLCLNSSECALENVEAVTINMLGVLGLSLDINVYGKPAIICKICSENLKKCFHFKTTCLYMEDCINSFKIYGFNEKLDLKEIYLKINGNKNIAVPKCSTICRLCMEITGAGFCIALNDETKDIVSAKIILGRCFSELNLDITENPVICTSCSNSLHTYFIKKHLDVEDEIKQYCETEGSSNKLQLQSSSALQFGAGNIPSYENGCTCIDIHKNYCKDEFYSETKLKLEYLMQKETQEVQIKHEVNEHAEVGDIEEENLSNVFKRCHENEQNDETELKPENFVGIKRHEFNIKHEEIEIKTENEGTARFQDDMQIFKDASAVAMHQCNLCKLATKCKDSLEEHLLFHKNISEIVMYQCEECDYKANSKRRLDTHMLTHRNDSEIRMYQCDLCIFKTRHKNVLKRHMLIHKNDSEVAVYSCGICTYKAKRKYHLQQHMLIHKNASEVTAYSCEMCIYKTKRKCDLKKHMSVHNNASEVTTDQCDLMIVHSKQDTKNAIIAYTCGICTYKTKRKGDLQRHMLIHKNVSEVTTYSCEICPYNTKRKSDLQQHSLIHKNASEVATYQCDICTFRTKYKPVIKQHVLIHINAAEVSMYACEICAYRTKQKSNLKKHMLIHKNSSEVTIYSCEICTYKTKQKPHFKQHQLIHKDASEVTVYRCEFCTFKTIHKYYLKKHVLNHRGCSNVTT